MKSKKLLIRVSCTTKRFYLQPPPIGRNDWHIRFTPPRPVREALSIGIVYRTTGHHEIEPAKQVARQIIEDFWNFKPSESIKARPDTVKLSEVFDRYRTGARSITDKEELKEATINGNIGALARIAETVHGREAENLTADILTADLLERFKVQWLAGVDRNDLAAMASAKQTVNGYMRQGRSLFGTDYMKLYRDLPLPDLTGFRAVKPFKAGPTRYVPIAQAVIDAMEAEIRGIRSDRPDLYLGFYFALWLGMRVGEIVNARREWIEEWPTLNGVEYRMAIVRRSYYKPKGIDGNVPIGQPLLQDINELSGASEPGDFLIPAGTMTDRKNAIARDLSALVRKHLPGRQKTCHELRKHAVSMVLMRTRNYVDALKFSRHADVKTLQDEYAAFLDNLKPITNSNWRAA